MDMTRLAPGEEFQLPELHGPGVIHHIWCTSHAGGVNELDGLSLRIYWDGADRPAVECPLGDFYGLGFGKAYRKKDDDTYSYKEIIEKYPDAARKDKVGETIWYNGVPTIEAKTTYAIDRKLAGMGWTGLLVPAPDQNSKAGVLIQPR